MLNEVGCNEAAIGDYYGTHGFLILKALEIGKHVVTDKHKTRQNIYSLTLNLGALVARLMPFT